MSKKRAKLPPHAKKVFTGEIFSVWQWEQKMFDGSTAIFEKLERPDTAIVIATVGDKILLQNQEQPDHKGAFPSIPGGRVDDGEAPLAAAKRELLEETGYSSETWKLWQEQNLVSKIIWTIYTYVARDCKKVQEPQLDAGEKITTRLISFDEFLELADSQTFYEKELKTTLVRAKYDPKERGSLKKLLFG